MEQKKEELPGGGEEVAGGMDATATYLDPSARQRWIELDLHRINADEEASSAWQWGEPHSVGANGRDRCFVRRIKGDPVWWIKVVGQVRQPPSETKTEKKKKGREGDEVVDEEEEAEGTPKTTTATNALMANVDNLLDAALHPRQQEWHQLYRGGRIVERLDEKAEVCYFKYASPIFFVSGRDTCYVKVRHDLPDGGFILSYRSIQHPDVPLDKDYVRLAFEGAHMITPLHDDDGEGEGFTYTYIQHADAKGRLPKWMANGPQADVMLKEIEGVRKALREGSIVLPSSGEEIPPSADTVL